MTLSDDAESGWRCIVSPRRDSMPKPKMRHIRFATRMRHCTKIKSCPMFVFFVISLFRVFVIVLSDPSRKHERTKTRKAFLCKAGGRTSLTMIAAWRILGRPVGA
jgi:hypothetical protein